jgi:microcin C transport system substrate-binding protein
MLKSILVLLVGFFSAQASGPKQGCATFGALKYGAWAKHYDYVNPNAPKGGGIRFAALGTFDSFNPFIIKGVAAAEIRKCFATLLSQSLDEPASSYAYVAETVDTAPDLSWVVFNINPKATFADGTPITADDIIFSVTALREKGMPLYHSYYKAVTHVEKLSERSVKFHCPGNKNREIALILGQLPALSKKFYETVPFQETSLMKPLCSGPYQVSEAEPGRFVIYERVKNWWGENLLSQKGMHNFDTLRYDYYRDSTAMFEAFKTGQVDYRYENVSRLWATGYDFPAVDKGAIVKKNFPVRKYGFTQGFFLNTRRDLFQDRHVRKALISLLDFEWANKNLFYGLYSRNYSYFADSEFDTLGKLEPAVKTVLETYGEKIPKEALESDFTLPKFTTEQEGRVVYNNILALLKEAGWIIRNQKLVHEKTGRPFQFEILIPEAAIQKIALHYKSCLEKVGIIVSVRLVDVSTYTERLEKQDFDCIMHALAQSPTPGNEQRDMWSSQVANTPNSNNVAGIHDPVVDDLIEKIIEAPDYETLKTYVKALDRVLLFGYYMVPGWKTGMSPVAYWNRFSMPDTLPSFEPFNPTTWWFDADKNAKVETYLGRYNVSEQPASPGFLSRILSLFRGA